jgi:YegS/Rv2252/BmrU family lipid kinase
MLKKQDLEKIIKKEKKAVLMVNTKSGKGRRLFLNAVEMLAARGISLTAAHQVRDPARFPGLVREAIGSGSRLIIVGGGDGTISSIVDYFAYQEAVFGLLPLGTANSFARTLGIPLTLAGACDVIIGGKVADIELGKVNEDYFANMVSIGFSADVARSTPRWLKRLLGPLAYSLSGMANFLVARKFRCDLVHDTMRETVNTHLVIVANGSFFGITDMSPEARIDNQQLFVLTMNMVNRWKLLLFWITFILRKHRDLAGIKYFTTRELIIETEPPRYIDIDGEARTMLTPAKISLAPEALKVMVPLDFRERRP